MVKIKKITKKKYNGYIYDLSVKNATSPYFFANGILTHNSLFPHIMIQCNIYGRDKQYDIGWNGYDDLKVLGFYNNKKLSKICEVIHDIYCERKELKKNKDEREMGLKIVLNIIYGILRNPAFKSVYDAIGGNDVCTISQYWTKYIMKEFEKEGYNVFYGDTDSIYFEDTYNNKEKFQKLINKCMIHIKNNVPFPKDTFDMDIDYEIEFIHFFKGTTKNTDEQLDEDEARYKQLGFLKKNYIFVTKDKQLIVKNLGIMKRSNTELSKKIFFEKMKPMIINDHIAKFNSIDINNWIQNYLENDISLISKRWSVKNIQYYKKSPGGLYAQIHEYIPKDKVEKLGAGLHFLIPNKRIGVGKGTKKYCTIEEFKKYCSYHDLILDVPMKELSYFNENYIPEKTKKIKKIKFADTFKQSELW